MSRFAPTWARRARVVDAGEIVREARFPRVGDDRRPEEPQPIVPIDHHAGVAIGEAGRIGHEERFAPGRFALLPPSAVDGHVVGASLARTAIPGDQQVAIRALDDPRRMVVLIVERKDELRRELRRGVGDAGQRNGDEGS